jgi:hypothetical protein
MKPFSVHCPHCHRFTSLAIASGRGKNTSGFYRYECVWKKSEYETWWIGICNSCHNPVLVLDETQKVYPHPLPEPIDPRVPALIRNDLKEARMCFSVEAYRAAAILSRRAIEATCLDKGVANGTLGSMIFSLRDSGVITKDIADWANAIRWVGNNAAHCGDSLISKQEADDILNLTEQLLNVVYVAPAIAQNYQKR